MARRHNESTWRSWWQLTSAASQALMIAGESALLRGCSLAGPAHLLLGILRVSKDVCDWLLALGVDRDALRGWAEARCDEMRCPGPRPSEALLSPEARQVLDRAGDMARNDETMLMTAHLLRALAESPGPVGDHMREIAPALSGEGGGDRP